MNRREAIRLLATGVALPLAPGSMLAMLREARAVVDAGSSPASQALRSLNAHQADTITAMAELILPRTDTPGATDVGACEFIDLILTEWYDEAERAHFFDGVAEVDARSQSLFGREFVSCSALQQGDILTDLGEKIVAAAPVVHNPRPVRGDWASKSSENFYWALRRLTLTAYFTSEAGATDALHYEVIPDRVDFCASAESAREAAKPE